MLLDYQNNYVGNSSIIRNASKSFDILATNLNVQQLFGFVANYTLIYFSKICCFCVNSACFYI